MRSCFLVITFGAMITETPATIMTADSYKLSALVIAEQNAPVKAVIQFNAGTVIRKEFYLKFAYYIAEQGYVVVLYDYRGVGESRPASLRNFDASIGDWGRWDATAMLSWIRSNYEGLPIYLLAHSMGGQILGLMEGWRYFDKITMITSSSGNWNHFVPTYRRKTKWPSLVLFPVFKILYGYIPHYAGLGQDWPMGVASQWRACSSRDVLMSVILRDDVTPSYYDEVDSQMTAFFFTDDHMATPGTVPELELTYPNARINTQLISPESYELERIGHTGLFKEYTRGKLWDDIIATFAAERN